MIVRPENVIIIYDLLLVLLWVTMVANVWTCVLSKPFIVITSWVCLLVFHGDLGGSCSAFLLIALYSAGTQ